MFLLQNLLETVPNRPALLLFITQQLVRISSVFFVCSWLVLFFNAKCGSVLYILAFIIILYQFIKSEIQR